MTALRHESDCRACSVRSGRQQIVIYLDLTIAVVVHDRSLPVVTAPYLRLRRPHVCACRIVQRYPVASCIEQIVQSSFCLFCLSLTYRPFSPRYAPLKPLFNNNKQADATGYDPKRSRVSDDAMETWKTSPTDGNLDSVPGIGAANKKKLAECDEQITNTYQLFGKFLMLKGPGRSGDIEIPSLEHTEKFWFWLRDIGISHYRSGIVKAIAEKSSTFFQGIYDPNEYEDEDDE